MNFIENIFYYEYILQTVAIKCTLHIPYRHALNKTDLAITPLFNPFHLCNILVNIFSVTFGMVYETYKCAPKPTFFHETR